jgi:3-methyladenine DNA glycosylase Tag
MATYVDRSQANKQKLQEIDDIQDKTKESIQRMQRMAAEAEETGAMTLDELRKQGAQMVGVVIVLVYYAALGIRLGHEHSAVCLWTHLKYCRKWNDCVTNEYPSQTTS